MARLSKTENLLTRLSFQAGIPSNNLLIALEPECAALYAMSLKDQRFHSSPGNKYALLDCGGRLDHNLYLYN